MKKLITLIALTLALAFGAGAQSILGLAGTGAAPMNFLVNESFEGTGAPASWAPSGTQDAPDWDDTSPSSGAAGSQSVKLYANVSADTTIVTPTFTATTDCYVKVLIYFTALPSTGRNLIQFRNSTTLLRNFLINSTGTITITGGSSTATGMSTGNWYYLWARHNASTGVDSFAWSATDSEPTSGNQFTSVTNAGTADTDNIRIQSDFSTTAGPDINVDLVKVAASAIGSN